MAMTQIDREKLERLRERKEAHWRWRLAHPHAHPELQDPELRSVLANELLILRRRMREAKTSMNSDLVHGIRMGLETFARRVQDVRAHGVKTVYAENFAKMPEQE